jgi:hypothetical protein
MSNPGPAYNDLHLQYEPYRFDLSDINFSTNPPDQSYLFMTDLDDPYYQTAQSLANLMNAAYDGNITSLSKEGKITTNFTDSCAAQKLIIRLARETNASEAILKSEYGTEMQQYLQYGSDVDIHTTFDDTKIGEDVNLTLEKAAFEDTIRPGSSRIRIYTTFKKPGRDQIANGHIGINPIKINYKEIKAISNDANSSADMVMHIPEGTKDNDQNLTFVYGKITPLQRFYDNVQEDEKLTPIFIDIYCDLGELDCNTSHGIGVKSLGENTNSDVWYSADDLFTY